MILVLKTVFLGVTGHEPAFRWTWLLLWKERGRKGKSLRNKKKKEKKSLKILKKSIKNVRT